MNPATATPSSLLLPPPPPQSKGGCFHGWAATGGGREIWLGVAYLLVFIRLPIFLMAGYGCVTKLWCSATFGSVTQSIVMVAAKATVTAMAAMATQFCQ
jgi:hypothetical protein